jgi:ankyrin repeat protein
MVAAAKGRKEIVKLLLEKNSEINARDAKGGTALMAALENGHLDVAEALINAGTDVNVADNSGMTAAAYAEEKLSKVKDLLKSRGTDE